MRLLYSSRCSCENWATTNFPHRGEVEAEGSNNHSQKILRWSSAAAPLTLNSTLVVTQVATDFLTEIWPNVKLTHATLTLRRETKSDEQERLHVTPFQLSRISEVGVEQHCHQNVCSSSWHVKHAAGQIHVHKQVGPYAVRPASMCHPL